ncbi:hypothetical protein TKK_0014145 [Trichogramma kaykai]|uniref:Insulin receptor substrate 1 n=1 Tax=Trichogramma kaykai TaxID=54128 RepID=A0ABD2WG48_9HYME
MEADEPLLQGYLLLPPQGMLGQLKKTWHKKFCQIFKASKYGIQRLEIHESQEDASPLQHNQKIITLEACVKISPSNQLHVFTLLTKTGVYHFGCSSEAEMSTWINAFQSVAFKDEYCNNLAVEEDNDLYCTSGEGVFTVRIAATDASRKCGLELMKNYTLIVGATEMKLMDGSKMLYTWPYQYIRKYGYREGRFTFEAGRRCGSGEGAFCLEHEKQIEIYRCFVSNKTKMKQLLNGGENSPTVENNEMQFHAALSMEAGSRSPLPPSKNLIDLDIASFSSQNSQKTLLTPISPTEPVKPPLPAKPKPIKPPRKPVFTTKLDKNPFDFEEIKYRKLNSPTSPENSQKSIVVTNDEKHSYDLVEVRNDAWKTHGVDNVTHTERSERLKLTKLKNEEILPESHYETMSYPISPQGSVKSSTSSIIHNIPSPNDSPDYDRLQHFGSYNKKSKSGYRTPNFSIMSQNSSQNLSQSSIDMNSVASNYNLVDDLNAVRLADDVHLGYGMIRKKSIPSLASPTVSEPKHKIINETEYAIVSKPKRV